MSFLKKQSRNKHKNPSEVVKNMRDALTSLEKANGNDKVIQKVRAPTSNVRHSFLAVGAWRSFCAIGSILLTTVCIGWWRYLQTGECYESDFVWRSRTRARARTVPTVGYRGFQLRSHFSPHYQSPFVRVWGKPALPCRCSLHYDDGVSSHSMRDSGQKGCSQYYQQSPP